MTRVAVATAALLTVSSVSAAAQENSGQRDGRYDARIQKRVTEELAKKDAFRRVSAAVEDSIVTLSGAINLWIPATLPSFSDQPMAVISVHQFSNQISFRIKSV